MPEPGAPGGPRRRRFALSPERPPLDRARRSARRIPCVEGACLFNHGRACRLAWMELPRRRVMDRHHCPNSVLFDGNEVQVSLSALF